MTTIRMFHWESFIAKGWNVEDLMAVAKLLKNKIRARQKWENCLNFSKMIGDTETFGENLAEARSLSRAPKPHPAHRELAATGRPTVAPTPPARSVADILAAEQAFKAFQQLKTTL